MKKIYLTSLLSFLVTVLIGHATTQGRYAASFHGTYTLTASEASNVFIKNNSTQTVYVAFGGHSVASTNDPDTYVAYRMPIDAGDDYTSLGKFSVVSVYCLTNGLVNIGFEGVE
jgi:hypothetical protein